VCKKKKYIYTYTHDIHICIYIEKEKESERNTRGRYTYTYINIYIYKYINKKTGGKRVIRERVNKSYFSYESERDAPWLEKSEKRHV